MQTFDNMFVYTMSEPHPFHTVEDWQEEAREGNTQLGYADWVQHQLEDKVRDYYDELTGWAMDADQLRGVLRILLGNMSEGKLFRLVREDPALKFLRHKCKDPSKFSIY